MTRIPFRGVDELWKVKQHDPFDLFLGFWERLGWRVRHERTRSWSSPSREIGYRWPYPTFS